jgi:hypothetical protein
MNSGFYAIQNPAIRRVLFLAGCPAGRACILYNASRIWFLPQVNQDIVTIPSRLSRRRYRTRAVWPWQHIKANLR